MMWRVVWNGDRSRRVIFAERFWASVEDASSLVSDPEGLRSAIEAMGDPILRLFAEHWEHLGVVTRSTRAHIIGHVDKGLLVSLVVIGRELPLPPGGGPISVVVESVSLVDRR